MLFSRFAQFAAASLLLAAGSVAPAHAQNNKQIISGTWYEDRAAALNNSSSVLVLTFAQTPTNQFLNITNISCAISVASTQVMTGMTLFAGTTSGANDLVRPYAIMGNVTPQSIGSSKYYSVTNQIYFKFGPGRYPSIEIDVPSTGTDSAIANCVIVGNLSDS
jgi:hypothetical protein